MKITKRKKIVLIVTVLIMFIIIVMWSKMSGKITRVFIGENEGWRVQVTFEGETKKEMIYRMTCQVEYIGSEQYKDVPLDILVHTWRNNSQRIGPFIWNSDEKHYFEITTLSEKPITHDSMVYFDQTAKIEIPVEILIDQKKMQFELIEK